MMSVPCAWAKLVPSAVKSAAALVAAVALSISLRDVVPLVFSDFSSRGIAGPFNEISDLRFSICDFISSRRRQLRVTLYMVAETEAKIKRLLLAHHAEAAEGAVG